MPAGSPLPRKIAHLGETASVLQGTVTVDPATGVLGVNIGGHFPPVRWTAGWTPTAGDQVRVLAYNGELVVQPRLTGLRAPAGTVTAHTAGATTCTVQSGGTTYACRFLASSYTPVVGDVVRLDWSEPAPFVLGAQSQAAAAQPVQDPVPAAPPGPAQSGTSTYPAIDSGYWSTEFGWSGGTSFGSRLMQGTSGGVNTGAWFYGLAPSELDDGREITAARVRVIRTNAYGDGGPSPAHLFAHTSPTRPVGNVALGVAATDATLPRGGRDDFAISVGAAHTVIAGGGLAISGAPYLVLEGVREHADSGLLEIEWRR